MTAGAPHTHSPAPSFGKQLGAGSAAPQQILLSAPWAPAGEVAVPAAGLGVLGCKPLSFQPAQGTHSPNRKEPVEREMWSDNRCSRKRGKKLLLKWQ